MYIESFTPDVVGTLCFEERDYFLAFHGKGDCLVAVYRDDASREEHVIFNDDTPVLQFDKSRADRIPVSNADRSFVGTLDAQFRPTGEVFFIFYEGELRTRTVLKAKGLMGAFKEVLNLYLTKEREHATDDCLV